MSLLKFSDSNEDILAFNETGKYMMSMIIVGLACFLFILFMDYNLLARLREKLKRLPSKNEGDEVEDADVAEHRKNIEQSYERGEIEEPLMAHNLSKVYGFKKAATKYLTFSVNRGECFGLLGVNGAGKTSTFKMLTGEISPTGGNAWINRHSVISSMDKARQKIGFCPQFDALFPKLTGREHLEFYCKLKGLKKESIESVSNALFTFLKAFSSGQGKITPWSEILVND